MNDNIRKIALVLLRSVLGLIFLFSGFFKGVDPWGSAIKFDEYFSSFGLDWLEAASLPFAIVLSGFEMLLGLMLLFGVWLRCSSLLTLLFMLFFTPFTLYIALFNPVADCGCFGDAIKLTNWQTFFKNAVILLPVSLLVWLGYRRLKVKGVACRKDIVLTTLFALVSCGVGVYSLMMLPIIDFLPYKVGVNLAADAQFDSQPSNEETTLIYRDKLSGKEHTFLLSDTTWHDSQRWEYVDTQIANGGDNTVGTFTEFALFDLNGEVTDEILSEPQVVMICALDISDISGGSWKRLTDYISHIPSGSRIICITASNLATGSELMLGNTKVECYNIDATTLKTMLRAKVGIVTLQNGTITDKVSLSRR